MKNPHYTCGTCLRAETRLWQEPHVSIFMVLDPPPHKHECIQYVCHWAMLLFILFSHFSLLQTSHWRTFWTKCCWVVTSIEHKPIKMGRARKRRNKRSRRWWLSLRLGSSHQNLVTKNTYRDTVRVWHISLTPQEKFLHICLFSPEGTATEKYTEPVKVETTEVRLLWVLHICCIITQIITLQFKLTFSCVPVHKQTVHSRNIVQQYR